MIANTLEGYLKDKSKTLFIEIRQLDSSMYGVQELQKEKRAELEYFNQLLAMMSKGNSDADD